jgi:hypothetical protein
MKLKNSKELNGNVDKKIFIKLKVTCPSEPDTLQRWNLKIPEPVLPVNGEFKERPRLPRNSDS